MNLVELLFKKKFVNHNFVVSFEWCFDLFENFVKCWKVFKCVIESFRINDLNKEEEGEDLNKERAKRKFGRFLFEKKSCDQI